MDGRGKLEPKAVVQFSRSIEVDSFRVARVVGGPKVWVETRVPDWVAAEWLCGTEQIRKPVGEAESRLGFATEVLRSPGRGRRVRMCLWVLGCWSMVPRRSHRVGHLRCLCCLGCLGCGVLGVRSGCFGRFGIVGLLVRLRMGVGGGELVGDPSA